jgi:hypothetical protein
MSSGFPTSSPFLLKDLATSSLARARSPWRLYEVERSLTVLVGRAEQAIPGR